MKETLNKHESSPLRSVQFVAGRYPDIFSGSFPHDQLEAVGEILDFSNSYVLNDVVSVSGFPFRHSSNGFGNFVKEEIEHSDSVETIGEGRHYDIDVTPFERALDLGKYKVQLDQIDDRRAALEGSDGDTTAEESELKARYNNLAEQARVLQQQSYILIADRLRGVYVPERLYGRKALEKYPQTCRILAHDAEEKLRERLSKEIESLVLPSDVEVRVPSFFVEALRSSTTHDGIWNALRDFRHSKAATSYRSLARAIDDSKRSRAERKEARSELDQQGDAIFNNEPFATRIPRSLKFAVGLSAAATSILVPGAGFVAVVPPILEGIEQLDQWVRKRHNIFEIYTRTVETDLFSEVKRLFPEIRFEAEHLAYYLKNRNFKWPERLTYALYPPRH